MRRQEQRADPNMAAAGAGGPMHPNLPGSSYFSGMEQLPYPEAQHYKNSGNTGKRDSQWHRDGASKEHRSYQYNDDSVLPRTLEELELKFIDDISRLSTEQRDAEDVEIARHNDALNKINVQYREKLMALRLHQATHREEFLRKESQSLHLQYQQVFVNSYQNDPPQGDAPHFAAGGSVFGGEPHGTFPAAAHYGERPEYSNQYRGRQVFRGGRNRGRGSEYPSRRGYNSGGRHF